GVYAQAIGDIEHGVEVMAEGVGQPGGLAQAGLKGKVAAAARGMIKGAADSAGDVDGVAGLGGGAEDRAAGWVGDADDGDRERERGVGGGEGGDVAADEGAVEVAGPAGDGVEE